MTTLPYDIINQILLYSHPHTLTGDDVLDLFLIRNTDISKTALAFSFIKKERGMSLSNLFKNHNTLTMNRQDAVELMVCALKTSNINIATLTFNNCKRYITSGTSKAFLSLLTKLLKVKADVISVKLFLHQICIWTSQQKCNIDIPLYTIRNVLHHTHGRQFVPVLMDHEMLNYLTEIDISEYESFQYIQIVIHRRMYLLFKNILSNRGSIPQWFTLRCMQLGDAKIKSITLRYCKPRYFSIQYAKKLKQFCGNDKLRTRLYNKFCYI